MKDNFTKSNLKSGDIVTFRNNDVEIVFKEQDCVIFSDFAQYFQFFNTQVDLTDITDTQWDIVKVQRPQDAHYLMKYCWDETDIIWERDEAIEMTLEEVCKALGKNIKIVKSK